MNNSDMPANVVTEEQWDRSGYAAPSTGLTKREHMAIEFTKAHIIEISNLRAAKQFGHHLSPEDYGKLGLASADGLLKVLEGQEQ